MQTPVGFTVETAIYEGVSSRIYRATRQSDGRPVILKLLKADYPSPREIARLRHEYEVARSLDLPSVIAAYSLEPSGAGLALVLEDFGGRSLAELLSPQLELRQVLRIAIALAESLIDIHKRNIIHKDLKPANIIINSTTGIVKITDFGIASRLARESSSARSVRALEGTLAYIAPEQTGRMNRAIDYRADFYSFGVTLYELLSGRRPFESHDALELIHAHIARMPTPPHLIDARIPPQLSALVLRLLAKTAEDRYQSAYGLAADLTKCLRQLETGDTIGPFTLGMHDRPERFQPPQRLYGREHELYELLAAFDRASIGPAELVLISGGAGVGKSALINELYKPITARRGYFLAGKFDQLRRNIPYSAFIQALSGLLRQLLAEDDAKLAYWCARIAAALGANGQLMIEIIPELALIVGAQSPSLPLPPLEAQNRFNLTFRNFIGALTPAEHPLALVLDDLQWADDASLQLLQTLMSGGARALLVVGAYRDNEVTPDHPLSAVIAAIAAAGSPPTAITIGPLDHEQLGQLTADALQRPPVETAELAALLHERTGGNPFFVNEFLTALADDGLLRSAGDHWEWDSTQIARRAGTDNVLGLMAEKIARLPATTQRLLSIAAALGGEFALQTLAAVAEIEGSAEIPASAALAAAIWPALAQHMLIEANDGGGLLVSRDLLAADLAAGSPIICRFVHDRVQQAAYEQLPAAERPAVHLAIGRALLGAIDGGRWTVDGGQTVDGGSPVAFGTLDQLNLGTQLIDDPAERLMLARLNLEAGQRAHAALAYQAARSYFTQAGALLPANAWDTEYELAFAATMRRAECEYLCRDFAAAERSFETALASARTPLEQAQIFAMRVVLTANSGNFAGAIPLGIEGLRLLSFALPPAPGQAEVGAEIGAEHGARAGRPIDEFINLPTMSDPHELAIMNLLLGLLPCAFVTGQNSLWAYMVLKMVNRSYSHGTSPAAAVAYGSYGIILATSLGDYAAAEAFGRLASALTEPLQHPALDSKIFFIRGTFLNHWRAHMRECGPLLQRARQTSLDAGDFLYAGYSQESLLNTLMMQGADLDQLAAEAQHAQQLGQQLGLHDVLSNADNALRWIACLRGQTASLASLSHGDFDEEQEFERLKNQQFIIAVVWYSVYKLQTTWMLGDLSGALKIYEETAPYEVALFGTLALNERNFYYALVLAARSATAEGAEREALQAKAAALQSQFAGWAANCPPNYGYKYAFISAELACATGDNLAAMAHYDQAVEGALAGGFVQHAAMAAERAAQLFIRQGQSRPARMYLSEARNAYMRWGAEGHARRLEAQYSGLMRLGPTSYPDEGRTKTIGAATRSTTSTTSGGSAGALDLTSALKAAEQLASEIVLERLLERLLHIALENAGAQRGLLIISDAGRLLIEAAGAADETSFVLLQGQPAAESDQLAGAIVSYVARTGESVVLDDAAVVGAFINDPYVQARQPRSLLCTPLVNQGRLAAILYLENNLVAGAFTPERLATLNLLAGQAAIAIENARLYTTIEASERRYRALFEESRDTIFITSATGKIEAMNPAGLALFGYSAEQMADLHTADLYADPDDRQRLIEQLISQGATRDFPSRALRKDGSLADTLITATERRDRDGALLGFQGIIRDVTQQRRAEQERLRYSAIERELNLARTIQESLLPSPRPGWPGLDLICASTPAREVGGDLYAYYRLDGEDGAERYAVAVGDVTGKGMPAALLMAVSLASLRSTVGQGLGPAQLLGRLDQVLRDYTARSKQNCALLYLEIERDATTLVRAANAGGIAPLLRRADGSVELLDIGGMPLGGGWGGQLGYAELTVLLAPGDLLLLVSDGVVEAMNSLAEIFGFERLEATLAAGPSVSAEVLLGYVQAAVARFVGASEPHDDMTIVVIRA